MDSRTFSRRRAALIMLLGLLSGAPPGVVQEAEPEAHALRLQETPGYSHPDEFVAFHAAIRTGEDGARYPAAYRVTELEKARSARKRPGTRLAWVERGPGNVPGRTRGLIVDPDDPELKTWYAGSVGGGLWHTTDGGASWMSLTEDLPVLSVSALAMAESDHDIIYMGTGEGFGNLDAVAGDGIFRSEDRGMTWRHLESTIGTDGFRYVNRLAVDPSDANTVLAATNVGIFRSTDGGESWNRVFRGRVQDLKARPDDFSVQFAAVNGVGIFRSQDAGRTWRRAYGDFARPAHRMELAIAPSEPDVVYFTAQASGNGSELYGSSDSGISWRRLVSASTEDDYNWLGRQGWYDQTLAVNPFDPEKVFLGGIRLWEATVAGDTARLRNLPANGVVHVDHHNILTVPLGGAGDRFMVLNANDGGVYYSGDSGERFVPAYRRYNTSQFYGVAKRPGINSYIGGTQDNGTWRSYVNPNATRGWLPAGGGDGFDAIWHSEDDRYLLRSYQYNQLERSDNGGASWKSAIEGMTDTGRDKAPFITSVDNSRLEPDNVFLIGPSGIWRSDDFAETWELIPVASPDWGAVRFGRFSSGKVRVSLASSRMVWAGFRLDDEAPVTGSMHVSADWGISFKPVSVPDMAPQSSISGLATHPHEDSTAYVLFSVRGQPKILRTTDLGQTWSDLSGFEGTSASVNGFPDVAVYDLLVMPHDTETIWVGTEIGLFISEDGGRNWSYSDNGLPAVAIWRMILVDNEVVLATHGRGVWTYDLTEILSVDDEREAATDGPRLVQNYPNPFGGITTLAFTLDRSAAVRVQVYDVMGRRVAELADRTYQAGGHSLEWDARSVPSGVYFGVLEAGGARSSRQMIVAR